MKTQWCPICGSFRSCFDEALTRNECNNKSCGLPCKFWDGIKDMIDELIQDEALKLMNGHWLWTGNGQRVFADHTTDDTFTTTTDNR